MNFGVRSVLAGIGLALLAGRASSQQLRAAHDIARGTVLAYTDIVAESSADAKRYDGWITRRIVRQGEVLKEPAIGQRVLVANGSRVRLEAVVDGVVVSRDGIATAAGSLGDRVRVRIDAQRAVTGTVTGPATVRLP